MSPPPPARERYRAGCSGRLRWRHSRAKSGKSDLAVSFWNFPDPKGDQNGSQKCTKAGAQSGPKRVPKVDPKVTQKWSRKWTRKWPTTGPGMSPNRAPGRVQKGDQNRVRKGPKTGPRVGPRPAGRGHSYLTGGEETGRRPPGGGPCGAQTRARNRPRPGPRPNLESWYIGLTILTPNSHSLGFRQTSSNKILQPCVGRSPHGWHRAPRLHTGKNVKGTHYDSLGLTLSKVAREATQ